MILGSVAAARSRWLRRIGISAFALWALFVGVPLPQPVILELRRAGVPLASLPVRLIASGRFGACEPEGVSGRTDERGRFAAQRWRWTALIDAALVIVQRDTICVDEGGGWRPIWSMPYGPALPEIRWKCDLASESQTNSHGVIFGMCNIDHRAR